MANAFLQIVSGARQGLTVPLKEDAPLVIGRKRGDFILDDPLVSGSHCRILPRDGRWVIQDMGSTNGTMVDGRLVRETTLRAGVEITVGASRMMLYIGDDVPEDLVGDRPVLSQLDIAWLLDEELVELRGSSERTRAPVDIISQDLRLPPGLICCYVFTRKAQNNSFKKIVTDQVKR